MPDKAKNIIKIIVIVLLGIIIGLHSSYSCSSAEEDTQSIKIGLLLSSTGTSANMEKAMINAAKMAFDEINANGGIRGKRIEYILEDYSSDPEMASSKLEKLITQEHVVATVGCYSSASRKATLPILEKYDSVLVYPAYTEGNESDPHVIYTGALPNQQSREYIKWLLRNEGKKVYLLGNDYLYPVEYNKNAKAIIDEENGTIVGETYVKAGDIDFESVLKEIREKEPDFIYCNLIGDSLTSFYIAFQRAGMSSDDYPIASVTTDEAVLQEIGEACGEGHYSAMSYFSTVNSAESLEFVNKYREYTQNGATITSLAETTYDSCYLLARALDKTEEPYDREKIMEAFSNLEFNAPQGLIHVDENNHCTWLYSRFARIHDGKFEIIYESQSTIRPEIENEQNKNGWTDALAIDTTYDVFWMPLLLIPFLIGFFQNKKKKYTILGIALAVAEPFLLTPSHGFANMAPSLFILIWLLGIEIIHGRQKDSKWHILMLYAFHIVCAGTYIMISKTLYHFFVQYNHDYWQYAFSYLPDNIINANVIILVEMMSLVFLITDFLYALPIAKRKMSRRTHAYEKYLYVIAGFVLAASVLAATVSTGIEDGQFLYISLTVNSYQNQLGNIQLLLLKEIVIMFAGCLVIHCMDYYYMKESDRLEMAETQRAVFESSNDMIWSVNGKTGGIVTSNEAARTFFAEKGMNGTEEFWDIWDKYELDIWMDYVEKAVENGMYEDEYYNPETKRYYHMTVHKVNLNHAQYDIAFFAKDVTEETELKERIYAINDELENRVAEKTKSLEEANKNLTRFSYMVAHELKAPIRAIKLYNELRNELKEREECNSDELIAAYCDKSLRLINDILEYTKSKESNLAYARINMENLVRIQIEENISISGLKNVTYEMDHLPNILGDEALIKCCLNNIISNSLKYSRTRENIVLKISAEQTDTEYIFKFSDNGIGFDMKYSENMFQLFHRLHGSSETIIDGSGVGLATVKNIIERHGGWIRAEAEINKGCTLLFGIPK